MQNQFNVKTDKALVDLLLNGEVEVASVRTGIDLINSGKRRLADAEMSLAGREYREMILTERLKAIQDYDYVFCDLSPTLTLINTMALIYCDYLLIPLSMSFYSITGAHQILEAAGEIRRYSKINLLGLVLNFYNSHTNLAKMVTRAVKDKWGNKVFKSVIRKNVAIEEAPSQRLTIFEHAPRSHGAEDFERLTEEFLGK